MAVQGFQVDEGGSVAVLSFSADMSRLQPRESGGEKKHPAAGG
jgi:hypothetical protein